MILPILLVVVLVLIFISPGEKETADAMLPAVDGWTMKEIDTYSPERFIIKEGIYKSDTGDMFVKLTLITSDDETKTKNKVEAMAHENIDELKEESIGMVGENEAKYISDEKFKIIYFVDNEKKGCIAISEDVGHSREFLSEIYGNVFVDI